MNNVASPAISIPHQHRFPSVDKKPHTACFISAELVLAESGLPLEGAVMELDPSGALFREYTHYILDRRKQRATLRLGAEELACTITRTTNRGYLVRFDEPLAAHIVDDLVQRYPLPG
jgi:hypothetical protein